MSKLNIDVCTLKFISVFSSKSEFVSVFLLLRVNLYIVVLSTFKKSSFESNQCCLLHNVPCMIAYIYLVCITSKICIIGTPNCQYFVFSHESCKIIVLKRRGLIPVPSFFIQITHYCFFITNSLILIN